MKPDNTIMLQTQKKEVSTGNFALTTALLTSGFPWFNEDEKCHNLYRNGSRPTRVNGKLTHLGSVKFHIGQTNETFPDASIDDALAAYDGDLSPGDDLMELLSGDGEVPKSDVLSLLPLAYVECSRNTLANLREVKKTPSSVAAHIEFIKDNGLPVIVSEDFDKDTAEKWGIDMGGNN